MKIIKPQHLSVLQRCFERQNRAYLGVAVNEGAQVIMKNDKPAANVFAAGEIMAGNILGKGYLAGIGMTIGTVFGRIAGKEAARVVRG